MHSKTFLAVFALATAVAAMPIPGDSEGSSNIWGASPPTKTTENIQSIESLVGSPFGNENSDGNDNSAGNGNDQNASGDGSEDGNNNGNENWFGNGNSIESGNAGIKIGRGDSWDQPSWTQSAQPSESDTTAQWIDGLVGSPFGNGNGDGNGNAAGNGNDGNAAGDGSGDGNGNGDGNTFGNGNDILSGNSGISIGKKVRKSETLGTYVGTIVDDVTVPLEPMSSTSIWSSITGSPSQNGNSDGNNNVAGSGNDGNASNDGSSDGNNNGDGNSFGNNDNILSGDCGICTGQINVDPKLTIG